MKTLVKNLLKSLPIIAIVAAMAYMAITGTAMAQYQPVPLSCDANQGTPCTSTGCAPSYLSYPYCAIPDAGGVYQGDYECLCSMGLWDFFYAPNDGSCVASWDCGSGACLSGHCCALPADTFNLNNPLACLGLGLPENGGVVDIGNQNLPRTEGLEAPFDMGCPRAGVMCGANGCWSTYQTPGGTTNNVSCNVVTIPGPCAGNDHEEQGNYSTTCDVNLYDFYQTWCDAGTSVLGGPQHLMKKDALDMGDAGAGLAQCVPLGWTGPLFFMSDPVSDNSYLWNNDVQPPNTATQYYPNYACQMPYYFPDGGWALANAGSNDGGIAGQDLVECGGTIGTANYFPCCGQEHDAGSGIPNLCQADTNGVSHCACVQDGQPCDRPRLLNASGWAGIPNIGTHEGVGMGGGGSGTADYEGMGECCSPGLDRQVYSTSLFGFDGGNIDAGFWSHPGGASDPYASNTIPAQAVIAKGQGFCRPDALDDLTPTSGSVQALGYCNCLPLGVSCAVDSDCCGGNICLAGTCHTPCTLPDYQLPAGQACSDTACCWSNCVDGGSLLGQYCGCVAPSGTCTETSQCCDGTGTVGGFLCTGGFDYPGICYYIAD